MELGCEWRGGWSWDGDGRGGWSWDGKGSVGGVGM